MPMKPFGTTNGNLLTNLTEGYDCINDYTGKETYSYNAWGQLVNYNNDVGETASYTYYSDGLRAVQERQVGQRCKDNKQRNDFIYRQGISGRNSRIQVPYESR